MSGLDAIARQFWHNPWAQDDLAWRVFDDEYLAEWRRGQGNLVEAMAAMWSSITENAPPPEYVVCNGEFLEKLCYVIHAPWWRRLYWYLRYSAFVSRLIDREDNQ